MLGQSRLLSKTGDGGISSVEVALHKIAAKQNQRVLTFNSDLGRRALAVLNSEKVRLT